MSSRAKLSIGLGALAVLAAAAYCAAFFLRFGGVVSAEGLQQLTQTLPLVVLAKLAAFYACGVHAGFSRYVSFEDLIGLAKAATLGSVVVTLLDALAFPGDSIPRGVLLIDWGATLMLTSVVRSIPRALSSLRRSLLRRSGGVRVLIAGASDDGEFLLRSLRTTSERAYRVVGFIESSPQRRGQRIGGVPVLGSIDDMPGLLAGHRVDQVLIVGALPGKQVRRMVEQAGSAGVEVRVLPTYNQLLRQDVAVAPRPVAIEDLLRRDPVEIDIQAAKKWVGGRSVLVTGSAGSIGSEVCRQLLRLGPAKLIAVDRSETGQFFLERELTKLAPPGVEVEVVLADLTDAARLRSVCEQALPDVVFHAAAYKHVPLMEQHPGEAVKNIVLATRNLADIAEETGASAFVMVSTDKAVNPTSVMGACKRVAERYVQAKNETSSCRFSTVRFGNVLGSSGSVAPVFREQIARGGPVTVTHPDMTRYFMMIPEAAQLVVQAGVLGVGGQIFVLDMGEPVRITDLARDMIRLSGMREGEDIEIAFTGLRPGEKLYEELYADQENHRVTDHPKIMVADSRPDSLLAVTHLVGSLGDARHDSPDRVRGLLKEALPEAAFDDTRLAAA